MEKGLLPDQEEEKQSSGVGMDLQGKLSNKNA